jgi:hypothetical protein
VFFGLSVIPSFRNNDNVSVLSLFASCDGVRKARTRGGMSGGGGTFASRELFHVFLIFELPSSALRLEYA